MNTQEKEQGTRNTAEETTKLGNAGDKMQAIGKKLTAAITLPILGYLIGGIIGLIAGILIGALILSSMKKTKE